MELDALAALVVFEFWARLQDVHHLAGGKPSLGEVLGLDLEQLEEVALLADARRPQIPS